MVTFISALKGKKKKKKMLASLVSQSNCQKKKVMHRWRQEHPGLPPRSDNDTKGGFVSTVTIHSDQGHSPLFP